VLEFYSGATGPSGRLTEEFSLRRLQLIKHARYYWLLLAESHLTRRLFAGLLRKIMALPVPPG